MLRRRRQVAQAKALFAESDLALFSGSTKIIETGNAAVEGVGNAIDAGFDKIAETGFSFRGFVIPIIPAPSAADGRISKR